MSTLELTLHGVAVCMIVAGFAGKIYHGHMADVLRLELRRRALDPAGTETADLKAELEWMLTWRWWYQCWWPWSAKGREMARADLGRRVEE